MRRIETLPERRVIVQEHHGSEQDVDNTRRPLYQHLIMHELVGGPSYLRFEGERIEVLVGATCGFNGDETCRVELLPEGPYAITAFEGPAAGVAEARDAHQKWASSQGAAGPILQMHCMDEVDGAMEVEFQSLLPQTP